MARRTLLLLPLASALQPVDILRPTLRRQPSMPVKAGVALTAAAMPPRSPGMPLQLAIVAAVACQGALQHGLQTGMLNVPQLAIASSLGISPTSVAFSAAVSIFCAGGLAGAQLAGGIADKGRKKLLLCSAVFCTLGGFAQYASGLLATRGLELLIIGRMVAGVGCGMATVGVPLYLGEIAPIELRGALGSLNQLGICIGIFVAQALGALAGKRILTPDLLIHTST